MNDNDHSNSFSVYWEGKGRDAFAKYPNLSTSAKIIALEKALMTYSHSLGESRVGLLPALGILLEASDAGTSDPRGHLRLPRVEMGQWRRERERGLKVCFSLVFN